ncbi:MAG: hypothetical protein EBT70_11965 [Betaproteobacteria bacterium]|nr:hypothetical protein [Betaproteobacteria bacterium]
MRPLHGEPVKLHWQDMPMPDANAPLRLARLHSVTIDHFWALVEFPVGWQRLRAGHYSVDEDFLLLHGDLTINGLTWGHDTHGVVPASRGVWLALGFMADRSGTAAHRPPSPQLPFCKAPLGPMWHRWMGRPKAWRMCCGRTTVFPMVSCPPPPCRPGMPEAWKSMHWICPL